MWVSLAQPGKYRWIPDHSTDQKCCAVSCHAYPTRTVYRAAGKNGKDMVVFNMTGEARQQTLRALGTKARSV
ncbi:hypothetical protein DSLASN_11820 [Desulfoluna limicola]|uniref:Uncharacterized protein n=1 Tax=Desulfoluna limicola TaxID=2810562 RepID=A0ABM7PEG2_9BACT|nr:hypothetical protein DSLASN_11820 [Desulfoluna limicola]